ncbi:MAG: hypothetical protein GX635_07590 [Synergistaceae bacterium]|nr:hypothetical protein [Synergistaceae bacterium]
MSYFGQQCHFQNLGVRKQELGPILSFPEGLREASFFFRKIHVFGQKRLNTPEGIFIGREETKREAALRMLRRGMSVSLAAEVVLLPLEEEKRAGYTVP